MHLLGYQHLLRFCMEEQVTISTYSYPYVQLVLKDIVARGIPAVSRRSFKRRRKEINDCLKFGYRHKLLNEDRRSRLGGDDAVQFWSLISEMKIGVWLKKRGIEIKDFEPPSAYGGRGDYLIERGGNTVFVEVKTVFGEKYMLDQDRLTADFAQYCQEKLLPVESVNLMHYPRGYDCAGKRDYLFEAIRKSIISYLPLSNERTISYEDKDGISIEILLSPHASRVVSRMYGGFSNILDDLKARLGMYDTDAQRRLQVSQCDIPSVCIINDFGSNIERIIIEDVLYGTLVADYTKSSKSEYYRKTDGRWSSGAASELNSVFVLRFEPNTINVQSVDAYLCPNPTYELPRSVFRETNLAWRKLDELGIETEAAN